MRTLFLSVTFLVLFTVSVPMSTHAAVTDIKTQLDAAGGTKGANAGTPHDPRDAVVLGIRLLLQLVGTVLFALNLYAGFLWMTAQGNEEQVGTAKTTIFNATLGLIVVLFAYTITLAITNFTQGQPIEYGAEQTTDPLEKSLDKGFDAMGWK